VNWFTLRRSLIVAGIALGLILIILVIANLFGRTTKIGTPPDSKTDPTKTMICPRTTQIQNGIGQICVYNCNGELYRLDVLLRGCPERLEF